MLVIFDMIRAPVRIIIDITMKKPVTQTLVRLFLDEAIVAFINVVMISVSDSK